ncbi:MAG: TIGR00725 family protein [Candidatus Kariarchaeaceae archaeon]|jgi:uncharacterized protein (TIGR00725 family)
MSIKRIAIIGSSDKRCTTSQLETAEKLGKELVDKGYKIINGGMGGIMEATAKGASKSKNYTTSSVIGILNTSTKSQGNKYSTIRLSTDLGTGRNRLIILNSDAVIAIGGRAGTFNKLGLALEFGKPIGAFSNLGGWSSKLAGVEIEDSPKLNIEDLKSVKDTMKWIKKIDH